MDVWGEMQIGSFSLARTSKVTALTIPVIIFVKMSRSDCSLRLLGALGSSMGNALLRGISGVSGGVERGREKCVGLLEFEFLV